MPLGQHAPRRSRLHFESCRREQRTESMISSKNTDTLACSKFLCSAELWMSSDTLFNRSCTQGLYLATVLVRAACHDGALTLLNMLSMPT